MSGSSMAWQPVVDDQIFMMRILVARTLDPMGDGLSSSVNNSVGGTTASWSKALIYKFIK